MSSHRDPLTRNYCETASLRSILRNSGWSLCLQNRRRKGGTTPEIRDFGTLLKTIFVSKTFWSEGMCGEREREGRHRE